MSVCDVHFTWGCGRKDRFSIYLSTLYASLGLDRIMASLCGIMVAVGEIGHYTLVTGVFRYISNNNGIFSNICWISGQSRYFIIGA